MLLHPPAASPPPSSRTMTVSPPPFPSPPATNNTSISWRSPPSSLPIPLPSSPSNSSCTPSSRPSSRASASRHRLPALLGLRMACGGLPRLTGLRKSFLGVRFRLVHQRPSQPLNNSVKFTESINRLCILNFLFNASKNFCKTNKPTL